MYLPTVITLLGITTCTLAAHQTPLSNQQYPSIALTLTHDYGQTWVSTHGPAHHTSTTNPKDLKPLVVFNDHTGSLSDEVPIVKTRLMKVQRPRSNAEFQAARRLSLHQGQSSLLEWDEVHVLGPDIEDRATLLELAKMTGNAYAIEGGKNWYPIDERWNSTLDFGWEVDGDGFRGHVFTTLDKSIVVLSIKGTTLFGGPTAKKDKINDNRLFSCCCGRVDWSWRLNQVCDCYSGGSKCDNSCLHAALLEDSVFYNSGIELFNNLTYMYPHSNIWVVGHSLGGALASLIGATFGVPVVGFEAPGERLAAKRLHLPSPPVLPDGEVSTYHVYHNTDPVPNGACTGLLSLCSKGGYAIETRCHIGKSILYDTATKKGWKTTLANHPIKVIITKVLDEDWEEGGRAVPEAAAEDECVECYKWEFGNFKNVSIPEAGL